MLHPLSLFPLSSGDIKQWEGGLQKWGGGAGSSYYIGLVLKFWFDFYIDSNYYLDLFCYFPPPVVTKILIPPPPYAEANWSLID